MRRASGEALMRPPSAGALAGARLAPFPDADDACAGSRAAGASFASASPEESSSGDSSGASAAAIFSPCSPIQAIVCPTGTSPSATAIRSRTPDASASTSWVTLSVSSS
jgi:hypothetical protein